MITSSPIQELEPGATPCRGGRCAAAILADRSSQQKKYLDYDDVPADGVEPPQGMPGAEWSRAIVCTRHCCVS